MILLIVILVIKIQMLKWVRNMSKNAIEHYIHVNFEFYKVRDNFTKVPINIFIIETRVYVHVIHIHIT